MTDFNKLADWHQAMADEPKRNQAKREKHAETARILHAAGAADVAGLMKLADVMADAACEHGRLEASNNSASTEPEERARTALESALRVAMAPKGWQPIETAPKDGTDVIVMYMHIETQIVHNAFFMSEAEDCEPQDVGWWTYTHSEVSRELLNDWRTPTHWMPLPAASQSVAAQEQKT